MLQKMNEAEFNNDTIAITAQMAYLNKQTGQSCLSSFILRGFPWEYRSQSSKSQIFSLLSPRRLCKIFVAFLNFICAIFFVDFAVKILDYMKEKVRLFCQLMTLSKVKVFSSAFVTPDFCLRQGM